MINSDEHAVEADIFIPIVNEYNLLCFLWDKFGIKPTEIGDLDPHWIRNMSVVASQQVKVQVDNMNRNKK